MANMSANILRNLVESVFNVPAREVILSGEIHPENSYTGNSCWSSQTTQTSYGLWGFNPTHGFVNLENHVGRWYNNTSGEQHGNNGTPLCDIPNVDSFLFFVVNEDIRCRDQSYDENNWTLYKAPNFKEHLDKINNQDLERWESWLIK